MTAIQTNGGIISMIMTAIHNYNNYEVLRTRVG